MVLDLTDEFATLMDDATSGKHTITEIADENTDNLEDANETFEDISKKYIAIAQNIDKISTYYGIRTDRLKSTFRYGKTKLLGWEHVTMLLDSNKLSDISGTPAEDLRVFDFVEEIDTIKDSNGLGYNNCLSNMIKTIVIPKNVTVINSTVFAFYKKLTTIIFEEDSDLMFLGSNQFCHCNKLTSVDLTPCKQLEHLGKGMFSGSGVKTVKLPSSIRTIDPSAFAHSDVKTVYIDNNKYTINEFMDELKNSNYSAFWYTGIEGFDF